MAHAHRIDVHHHPTVPEEYGKVLDQYAAGRSWTIQRSLDNMEQGGVAVTILSVPVTAGTMPKENHEVARKRARQWNEFMAKLCHDYPGRFGMYAALPIFDIEGSLREAEYALDTLHADGVNLMTNIGERWLGDPHYAPLFEELNRRKAIVYTHPMAPTCCMDLVPGLNDSVIEFATDTARAIARLLFSGSAARYPDIRFIFSHAGGTMPFIVERFTRAILLRKGALKPMVPNGVMHELRKLYYDTAQAAHRGAMFALREVVPVSQIVFGTDFPWRTAEETARGLAQCGFSEAELRAIDCENAQRLMPRWKA
jgi:6-methylsalicylate decarboxylase